MRSLAGWTGDSRCNGNKDPLTKALKSVATHPIARRGSLRPRRWIQGYAGTAGGWGPSPRLQEHPEKGQARLGIEQSEHSGEGSGWGLLPCMQAGGNKLGGMMPTTRVILKSGCSTCPRLRHKRCAATASGQAVASSTAQRSAAERNKAMHSAAHLTWPPAASRSPPPPRASQTPRTHLQGGVGWQEKEGQSSGVLRCALQFRPQAGASQARSTFLPKPGPVHNSAALAQPPPSSPYASRPMSRTAATRKDLRPTRPRMSAGQAAAMGGMAQQSCGARHEASPQAQP